MRDGVIPRGWRTARFHLFLMGATALAGCSGRQSVLDPASDDARAVTTLFWIMASCAGAIWIGVVGLALYAARTDGQRFPRHAGDWIVGLGGAALPTVLLACLLTYGLALLPKAAATNDGVRISVSGEQWWWRISYSPAGSETEIVTANEIRLPVGRTATFELSSPDVIHSFWIPPLAGKLDMIPGRTNRLILTPARTGTFRGMCAEFCGESHALMAFPVIVMEADAFDAWLQNESSDADPPAGADTSGLESFLAAGCGACHTVRGTPAGGTVGPDLTHVGSRRTLAAGTLANTPENMRLWIADAETIKPGSFMPSFGMLADDEIAAIATYLSGLQ